MNANNGAILSCRNICKAFPGVKALDNVDFDILPGEIHGLVGENGAGKSTLMKIFSGIYTFDEKKGVSCETEGMFFEGKRVNFRSPADALKNKIMTIHQEINVIPDLTVYENIYLNEEIFQNGLLNRKKMIQDTAELINSFGVEINPTDIVGSLPADRQKLVEVLKAISKDAKVLIMDEPTSVLADAEALHLFETVKKIAEKGIGIVFISHNLNEIVKICSRVTVLRDGKKVCELQKDELSVDLIVSHMIGKKISQFNAGQELPACGEEVMLKVENLSYKNLLKNVSFELHRGEILGITGLVGSGGTELAKVLFGAQGYKKRSGELYKSGKKIDVNNTVDAIQNGISLLTDDRKSEGLFLSFKLSENITIASLSKYLTKLGILKRKEQRITAAQYIEKLNIKTPGVDAVVESLSGGNQQKVVIAKWLETNPDIFIMDEPTIGIDIAAKAEVRHIIQDLITKNKSVILITNEYAEIETLCHRVIIMFRGNMVGEFSHGEINESKVMKFALGGGI